MSDLAISVENLSKQFAIGRPQSTSLGEVVRSMKLGRQKSLQFWALDDLNFDVQKGDRVGLIGKNGAGKSTLLKILSKITYPTLGKITIEGRVSSLLEVGTGFHPELSGHENIFLNGAILGMTRKEIKAKYNEIVAFSGIEKHLHTAVKHYSSGMYVRLAFSVAAHLEPEVLIIDEVLAVGDTDFQKKCIGKMEQVSSEGRTVLFVSHNMAAVSSLCNRIMILSEGKMDFDTYNLQEGISRYFNKGLGGEGGDCINQCDYVDHIHNLRSISLTDGGGNILRSKIHASQKICLEIDGELFEDHTEFNIGFILYKRGDLEICQSWLKSKISSATKTDKGSFQYYVDFPSYFFTTGMYTIEIVSVLHNVKNLISQGNGPRIDFEVLEGLSAALINPKFKWQGI